MFWYVAIGVSLGIAGYWILWEAVSFYAALAVFLIHCSVNVEASLRERTYRDKSS